MTMGKIRLCGIAAVLALACLLAAGNAFGQTVTVTDAGDSGDWTLRDVIENRTAAGDSIGFADGITRIRVESMISTYNRDLTITGRDAGFGAALSGLLAGYGIDAATLTADFSGLEPLPADLAALSAALRGLTLPGVVLEGDTTGILEFTGGNANTTITLEGLVLRNAACVFQAADVDNSGNRSAANASSTRGRWGGALRITAGGELNAVAFLDNRLVDTAGAATAGAVEVSSNDFGNANAYARANASAYGGGAQAWSGAPVASSLFAGNSAIANAGTATAAAAACSSHFSQQGTDYYVNVTADASVQAYADAYGGGAYLGRGEFAIASSLFFGNSAVANGGTARAARASDISGVSGYTTEHIVSADASARAYALAYGGGAYLGEMDTISSSIFAGNSAAANAGTAIAAEAAGTSVTYNTTYASAYAQAHAFAYGGGAYFTASPSTWRTNTISSSIFAGNSATANAGTAAAANAIGGAPNAMAVATAYAAGGGAYMGNSATIASSVFTGNSVVAVGGALARSTADSWSWANADAYAHGGGAYFIYRSGGDAIGIADSIFFANSAAASAGGTVWQNGVQYAPEAQARGGAVFVGIDGGTNFPSAFTLSANDGATTVISGNRANGAPDGIHFGRGGFGTAGGRGYLFSYLTSAVFTVETKPGGAILMQDPVTAELCVESGSGASFTMNVIGGADAPLVWGGRNVLDADGGSTVIFDNDSSTLFSPNFTLTSTHGKVYRIGSPENAYAVKATDNTNDLTVKVGDGGAANLLFDAARGAGMALFDFSNSTSAGDADNFTVYNGSTIAMDTSRKIASIAAGSRYLVADGLEDANAANQAGNFDVSAGDGSISGIEAEGGQIYAVSSGWDSPFQAMLDQWENQQSSANPLELLLSDQFLIDENMVDTIRGNLENTTPDQVLDQAIASLRRSGFVAGSAIGFAFLDDIRDRRFAAAAGAGRALASLAPPGRRGPRAWGGYVGYFDRIDSRAGRRGYRQSVNGALAGLTMDLASASVGAYFGYTRGNMRVRDQRSEVKSDGLHAGLLARLSPLAALPRLALTVDGGFSHYDNQARRDAGVGRISADFGQRTWTAGLAVEHEFDVRWAYVAPYAEFRYIYLDQNEAAERGGLTAAVTDKLDGESLTSELGLRLSRDIRTSRGAVSPYASVAWRHEFGDRQFSGTSRYHLANHYMGALPSFAVDSARLDRDSAVLGVGLRLRKELSDCRAVGLRVGYTATLNRHAASHAVSAVGVLEF